MSGKWGPVRKHRGGTVGSATETTAAMAETGSCSWGRGQRDASECDALLGAATRCCSRRKLQHAACGFRELYQVLLWERYLIQ